MQTAPGGSGEVTEEPTEPKSSVLIIEEPQPMEEGQISGSSSGFSVPAELVDSYDAMAKGGDEQNLNRIVHILTRIRLWNPCKGEKLPQDEHIYYMICKKNEDSGVGEWGTYEKWHTLPDFDRVQTYFACEWDALVEINECPCLVGSCQMLWPQADQKPAEHEAYLYAMNTVPFDHWAYILKPDPSFHQQMLPYLLMLFYYVGFRNAMQNWLTWTMRRDRPFFRLTEEERKQFVLEVTEDFMHVA